MEYVVVYRTSLLWELDLVRDTLTREQIPFFVQTQLLSGVTTALQAAPSPGFGTRWLVQVPEEVSSRAEEIIAALNVSKDSDTKFFPSIIDVSWKKRIILAAIIAIPIISFFIWICIGH